MVMSVSDLFISIPYGSIKSYQLPKLLSHFQRFQFLMVQLKGFFRLYKFNFSVISIPYGSIKSSE